MEEYYLLYFENVPHPIVTRNIAETVGKFKQKLPYRINVSSEGRGKSEEMRSTVVTLNCRMISLPFPIFWFDEKSNSIIYCNNYSEVIDVK